MCVLRRLQNNIHHLVFHNFFFNRFRLERTYLNENSTMNDACKNVYLASENTCIVSNLKENFWTLRAILQESEAKLKMKNYKPPLIFVGGIGGGGGRRKGKEVTLGDKQKQPYLDRQMYRCHGNRTR